MAACVSVARASLRVQGVAVFPMVFADCGLSDVLICPEELCRDVDMGKVVFGMMQSFDGYVAGVTGRVAIAAVG